MAPIGKNVEPETELEPESEPEPDNQVTVTAR